MTSATRSLTKARKAFERDALPNIPKCGTSTLLLLDRNSGDVRVVPMRCHKWSCPSCASRKIAKVASKARRGHPSRHIVLTAKPMPTLSPAQRIDWLRGRFKQLIQFMRRHRKDFEYLAALELQKNGTPHLHILHRGQYIPHRWLSGVWFNLTGSYIVHIKKVERTENAINELVKYLAKTAAEIEGLHSRKPVVTCSRGWCIDDEETDPSYSERNWMIVFVPYHIDTLLNALTAIGVSLSPDPECPAHLVPAAIGPPQDVDYNAIYCRLSESQRNCLDLFTAAMDGPEALDIEQTCIYGNFPA